MKSFTNNLYIYSMAVPFFIFGLGRVTSSIKEEVRRNSWLVRDEMVIQNKEIKEQLDIVISSLNYLPTSNTNKANN